MEIFILCVSLEVMSNPILDYYQFLIIFVCMIVLNLFEEKSEPCFLILNLDNVVKPALSFLTLFEYHYVFCLFNMSDIFVRMYVFDLNL